MTAANDTFIASWNEFMAEEHRHEERFAPRFDWNLQRKKYHLPLSSHTIKGLHIKSPRSPEEAAEAKALHAEYCTIVDDIGMEDPKVMDQRIEAFNRKIDASRPTTSS